MKQWRELTLDLRGCDARQFTRPAIKMFMRRLCGVVGMRAVQLEIWGYDDPAEKAAAPPHLKGTSAVQFIETSNITLHCLDDLGAVYLNLFTCGEFGPSTVRRAIDFCVSWFDPKDWSEHIVDRGDPTPRRERAR